MSGPSYTGTVTGIRVTKQIDGAHPKHPNYPLLPGDLLVARGDGTFNKFGPGLAIVGFELTPDQILSTEPAEDVAFGVGGMDYFLSKEGE